MALFPLQLSSIPEVLHRSGGLIRPLIKHFGQARELQQVYEQCRHLNGLAFIAQLLSQLDITVAYDATELSRLPAGAFVAIASRPCSLVDSLVLLYVLGANQPELRMVADKLLAPLLPHLADQLLPTKAAETATGHTMLGVRQLLRHLHNDVPLLFFPASNLAHHPIPFSPTSNLAWSSTANRFLCAVRVPVIPVWLSGQGSSSFNLVDLVNPRLRTTQLPAELLSRRGQTIEVRIGPPVVPALLDGLSSAARVAFLQARLSALSSPVERQLESPQPLAPLVVPETLVALIEADIAALRPGRRLVLNGRWEVYVAKKTELPHVLCEMGRLRELASRHDGKGTLQPTGLDAHDEHHRHLFLYDRDNRQLVGACRLGLGETILRHHGRRGFHLSLLFQLKRPLKPLLRQAIEFDCAFVRAEYQEQELPLSLLWKGVAEYLAKHSRYRYLLGPVNISRCFPGTSKAMLVKQLTHHFFNAELAAHVRTRKQFQFKPLDTNPAPDSLPISPSSSYDLQQFMAGFQPKSTGVPLLLRRYLVQNACLLGFNLAPDFSNALNGLLLIDARELPARIRRL